MKKIFDYILNLFTEHPRSIGESYLMHLFSALKLSLLSAILFFVFIIHSIFPFLFKNTGCFIVELMDDTCKRGANYKNNSFEEGNW